MSLKKKHSYIIGERARARGRVGPTNLGVMGGKGSKGALIPFCILQAISVRPRTTKEGQTLNPLSNVEHIKNWIFNGVSAYCEVLAIPVLELRVNSNTSLRKLSSLRGNRSGWFE